jgi:hypothetical protein
MKIYSLVLKLLPVDGLTDKTKLIGSIGAILQNFVVNTTTSEPLQGIKPWLFSQSFTD